MIKKVEPTNDVCIKFTDEELAQLKIEQGTKFAVKVLDNGSIQLTPFGKMEIDLSKLPRKGLEKLIIESCEKDISINEVISNILRTMLANHREK